MDMVDWILIIGAISALPLCGLVAWVYGKIHERVVDRRYEMDELREKLETAEHERDGWKETAESTDKLLRAAVERADRLAAMNEGLTEDLAALKAYDPEEIEERLKKIREIKANEERMKQAEKIKELTDWYMLSAQLNALAGNCVSTATQSIANRWTAGQYGVIGR